MNTDLNPIKKWRQAEGLTQARLAWEAGVTRLVVILTEQGVYTLPPPAILDIIQRTSGTDRTQLELEYQAWVTRHRYANRDRLKNKPTHYPPVEHPLVEWRYANGLSQVGFCKLFCVHPSVIAKFESGEQINIPSQLAEALEDAVIPTDDLGEFFRRVRAYNAASQFT